MHSTLIEAEEQHVHETCWSLTLLFVRRDGIWCDLKSSTYNGRWVCRVGRGSNPAENSKMSTKHNHAPIYVLFSTNLIIKSATKSITGKSLETLKLSLLFVFPLVTSWMLNIERRLWNLNRRCNYDRWKGCWATRGRLSLQTISSDLYRSHVTQGSWLRVIPSRFYPLYLLNQPLLE